MSSSDGVRLDEEGIELMLGHPAQSVNQGPVHTDWS